MPAPTIAVVIPSHRRLPRLPPLIRTYLDQGADEIVIVLDGPHPGWREALHAEIALPRVTIDELVDSAGLALARVAGLERSSSDVILMADDDVDPGDGLIDVHRRFHAEHPASALLGYMPVDLSRRRGRDQAPTYIYARDYENQVAEWERGVDEATLFRSFWTGDASATRALLLAAEEFMPSGTRLNYNEDLDLGLRLEAIGARIGFDRSAAAVHRHDRTIRAYRSECVRRGVAVADLEMRWEQLPAQLVQLIEVPASHGAVAARLQRHVALRDAPGVVELAMLAIYRVAGVTRLFGVQDAIGRFLRRALAIRGYRARKAELHRATGGPDRCRRPGN